MEAYREFDRTCQEGYITVLPVLGLDNFYFVRDGQNQKIRYGDYELPFANFERREATIETEGVKEKVTFLHTSNSSPVR